MPRAIWPAQRTRVFCCGIASSSERIEAVELLVDGAAQRPDRQLAAAGREQRAVRFWGALQVLPHLPDPVRLEVRALLASGSSVIAELCEIEVEPPPERLALERPSPDGLIAVCLATFDPEPELLQRQLNSLRAQTDPDWICVISDDCSRPERLALIEAEIEGDSRFLLSRSQHRLGFYRNFERALRLAPRQARLLALCDQDDRWHPDKLATLRAAIGAAPIACSDARLTDPSGRVLSEQLWPGRRFDRASLASCLILNAIPGASMLLRREVAEMALPFPHVSGWAFHDRWLAAVGMALGSVAYVERPLYDYVQHPGGVLGGWVGKHASASGRADLGPAPPRPERWRGRYFYAYEPVRVYALTLQDRRLAVDRRARRELRSLAEAGNSIVALAWLATRLLRPLLGRDETKGSERILLTGALWMHLAGAGARIAARLGRPLKTCPPEIDPAAISVPGNGRLAAAAGRIRGHWRRRAQSG